MSDKLEQRPLGAGTAQEGQFSSGVELLSKSLRVFFTILAGFIIIALAWFLIFGGSFIVDNTTESVVVLRFGKFHAQYDEGWHWFLPYPVNKIIRIPTLKQEVRTKSFIPANPEKLYDVNKAEDPMLGPTDTLIPGKDGYVLLGDNSIMHCEWIMTYKVSNPTKYFLNCMSKETTVSPDADGMEAEAERITLAAASAILKNLLDDAVICSSARLNIQKTYYEKALYEQAVKQELIKNLNAMDIGIGLESLTLRLVKPPIKTLAAFQQLLLSETLAERSVEEARTYHAEQMSKANAEAKKIEADALAYKKRIVEETKADAEYFLEIKKEYDKNKEAALVSLFTDTLAESMTPVKDKFILGGKGASQTLWLKLNQEPARQQKKTEEQDKDKKAGE